MLAIIGGSGLGEALHLLGPTEERILQTPFGVPSAPILLADVEGVPVALLSRHGKGHLLNPSQIPYRANIYALKSLGVTRVLASGAVGSLREDIAPCDLVLPDQVIDKTFRRPATFFDDISVHVEMSTPFCPTLRRALEQLQAPSGVPVHSQGTYVCIEGPQLSTRAESELHRAWGAHVVGMTSMPEAKLAREAELCYAMVAFPTDYDCWRPAQLGQRSLLDDVIVHFKRASNNALELIRRAIPKVAALDLTSCGCPSALEHALWSDLKGLSCDAEKRLPPWVKRSSC